MQQVVEQLKKANANIIGVVLNRVNEAEAGHYYYYYYYYNRYNDKGKKNKKGKKSNKPKALTAEAQDDKAE